LFPEEGRVGIRERPDEGAQQSYHKTERGEANKFRHDLTKVDASKRIDALKRSEDGATPWGAMSRAFVKEAENERVRTGRYPPTAIRDSGGRNRQRRQAGRRSSSDAKLENAGSAEAVQSSADKSQASFGMTVTCAGTTSQQSSHVVGEDEADPSCGYYVVPRASRSWREDS
jgi:Protein of unknown function (DUF3072)